MLKDSVKIYPVYRCLQAGGIFGFPPSFLPCEIQRHLLGKDAEILEEIQTNTAVYD